MISANGRSRGHILWAQSIISSSFGILSFPLILDPKGNRNALMGEPTLARDSTFYRLVVELMTVDGFHQKEMIAKVMPSGTPTVTSLDLSCN